MSQNQFNKARTLAEQSYATFELLGHRQKHVVRAFLEHIPPTQEDHSSAYTPIEN
jgi:hypothetical protein